MTTITEFVSKYWLVILIILYLVVTINKSTSKEHMSSAPSAADMERAALAHSIIPSTLTELIPELKEHVTHGTGDSYESCVDSCSGDECGGGSLYLAGNSDLTDTKNNINNTFGSVSCMHFKSNEEDLLNKYKELYERALQTELDTPLTVYGAQMLEKNEGHNPINWEAKSHP
jgi:hypothetical protein